jgi:hypothetical protein
MSTSPSRWSNSILSLPAKAARKIARPSGEPAEIIQFPVRKADPPPPEPDTTDLEIAIRRRIAGMSAEQLRVVCEMADAVLTSVVR